MTRMVIVGPSQRWMEVQEGVVVRLASLWRRRKDGVVYEIVWMTDQGPWETRLQLRRQGLMGKTTHWIYAENLIMLYEELDR